MFWLIFGCTIPSMVVCWAAAFAVRRWGPRWGLIDRPGHRKVHQVAMPTSGGLAIWLGIVLPLAVGQMILWASQEAGVRGQGSEVRGQGSEVRGQGSGAESNASSTPEPRTLSLDALRTFVARYVPGLLHRSGKLWELLAGGTVLMLLGLADDRRGLDWRLRLGVQTAVAVVLVALGWRMSLFLEWLNMPWLMAALSVLWIVGLVNSFNMLDNMDGLSAGVAAIAAAMFAAMMLLTPRPDNNQPQLFVAGLLLVIVGSLLGFLWHNRPPARLFMGDAGSYLVGYLLAMATLTGTFAGVGLPKHAILGPLCVLAVPLYDTATVVWIRLRSGRSPFVGDKSHFSHRLVELGLTKTQAVLTIYLATATCGLGALLLRQLNLFGALVVVSMVACTLALVAILETVGRQTMSAEVCCSFRFRRALPRLWRPWLLGGMTALFVARPLFPSEAAATYGDGLPVVMLWIALGVFWLLGAIGQRQFQLRFGWTDAAVLLLVMWHTVAALWAVAEGTPRPAMNMLWEWVGLGLCFFLARQLIATPREGRAVAAVMVALAVAVSGYGLYQCTYEFPATRAIYKANPERALRPPACRFHPTRPDENCSRTAWPITSRRPPSRSATRWPDSWRRGWWCWRE